MKRSLLFAALALAGVVSSQASLVPPKTMYEGAPKSAPPTPAYSTAPNGADKIQSTAPVPTPAPTISGSTISGVPEPTTALFGVALWGFAATRRSRR
jgi:hypothetical protein